MLCCRYTIDRRTDMDRVFNVHAGNGSVYVLRELDREENAWHNFSVIATEFSEFTRRPPPPLGLWSVRVEPTAATSCSSSVSSLRL